MVPPVLSLSKASRQLNYQAREVGIFSVNSNGERKETYDNLRVYRQGNLDKSPINLVQGFRRGCMKDGYNSRLDNIVWWMSRPDRERVTTDVDFVTARGHMLKFMMSPFNRYKWVMAACLVGNTVYISEVQEEENSSEHSEKCCHAGKVFETIATDHKDSATPSGEFYSVVKATLGDLSILMAAEIDCCQKRKQYAGKQEAASSTDSTDVEGVTSGLRTMNLSCNSQNYIEIKLTAFKALQSGIFGNFKLPDFWAKCTLVNVPKVICGFRDDNFMFLYAKEYKTADIPQLASSEYGAKWKPSKCFASCYEILQFVKEHVIQRGENVVHIFSFENRRVSHRESTDKRDKFLPEWFLGYAADCCRKGTRVCRFAHQ